jgi:hypothetical protein
MSAQRKIRKACTCKGCTTGTRECDSWLVRHELPIPGCDCDTCVDARIAVKAVGGKANFLKRQKLQKELSRGLSNTPKYKNKSVKLAIPPKLNNVIEFPGNPKQAYCS